MLKLQRVGTARGVIRIPNEAASFSTLRPPKRKCPPKNGAFPFGVVGWMISELHAAS